MNPTRSSNALRTPTFRAPLTVAALAAAALVCACSTSADVSGSPRQTARRSQVSLDYPDAARGTTVDTYEGTAGPVEVADPYRWLEDVSSPETRAWIEAQNELTRTWFEAGGSADRDVVQRMLESLWDYERYGLPFTEGGKVFYSKNDGLQNQSVMYVVDEPGGEPRVLMDPNTLSEDGTVALSGLAVSKDGKHLAYGLAEAGSDWNTWKVREIATGRDLEDEVSWVKFSGASWVGNGAGFFYSRYDAPTEGAEYQEQNFFHKLYFHKVGTPQSQDLLVYEQPEDPEWNLSGSVTDDGRYLVIGSTKGTDRRTRIFYKDLTRQSEVTPLIPEADARYSMVASVGDRFYFRTHLDAPMSRLIAVDLDRPQREHWVEVLPEGDSQLNSVSAVGGHLIASYLVDARSEVKVYDLDGRHVRDVDLPGIGSAGGFGGELDDERTWYSFSSYTNPGQIFEYEVATGETTLYRSPELTFDPDDFTTEQVFYRSKDGTRVPMFLTYKKGLKRDGENPTLLYGYGGFNIPMTPGFSPARLGWMQLGGVYAVANLRGGSEYGEAWHEGGMKLNKQNVFDDFIAAGEWLVKKQWTNPSKLAINGGSNGGLLVGACVNQRPDLFGAAIPAVGVMDMLRFPKFTIGWAWVSDYGSPENPEEFDVLRSYSPYHNAVPGTCYPPVMVVTSDHDDRVVPAHSFKYAAAMQAAQGCDNPILIRIETRAGHGAGKPTSKRIEEAGDQIVFMLRSLGVPIEAGSAQ